MALAEETGTPPSVTHEQIEAWNKLANDVTAALTMGGQQGLDLLINIMPEWCEAVDDVNAARQVCIDLADRGLRDEAIGWHAEGFFEVADRLDPDRPGWEPWEAALRDRDVITPRVDVELKEMANGIHEALALQDLSGQSLADHLAQLRRNMLLRGHLGERLVILESIRGLDPAGDAWQRMLSPIRRRRVDMIADEAKAAIARRDFDALAGLREEVASQDWGTDLPGGVTALLEATGHCEALGELGKRLSQAASTIVGRHHEAHDRPPESPAYVSAVEAANAARHEYGEIRRNLVQAIRGAGTVPETAEIVAESGVRETIRQLDASIRDSCGWLDEQEAQAQVRAVAGDIEAELMRVIESAPAKEGDRESFDLRLGRWKQQASNALEKSRKTIARLPGGLPPATTAAVIKRVEDVRRQLEGHSKRLRDREKLLVLGVVGGVVLIVVILVLVLIVASILNS